MRFLGFLSASLVLLSCVRVEAAGFTVCSYNCGGLSAHYDYLRAASMQKLMRDRYLAEPLSMSINERIQKVALRKLFPVNSESLARAQAEWEINNYQQVFEQLTMIPGEKGSPNTIWSQRSAEIITTYQVRPVVIYDSEVHEMLAEHVKDLKRDSVIDFADDLADTRAIMAARIFSNELKHDIICLQEADYLAPAMFPEEYELQMSSGALKTGLAWNRNRFKATETIGNIRGRAFAAELLDLESGEVVLVASCHLSGCNPYKVERDPKSGGDDSSKGDAELQAVVALFSKRKADVKLIGMDSNVTALHPRLNIVKKAGYRLDAENYLEATCTNPHTILDTRIDWILIQAGDAYSIVNMPVLGIGLNSIQTNMSDHKPIAAKIHQARSEN